MTTETPNIIEPLALVVGDREHAQAWACGQCRIVCIDEGYARRHCQVQTCECGKSFSDQFNTTCRDCRWKAQDRRLAEKEREAFEKAEKIRWQDCTGSFLIDEHYLEGVDELCDHLNSLKPDARPEYVWAARPIKFEINAENIVQSVLENHHDAAGDQLDDGDYKELQALLDAWCVKTGIVSYEEDRTRAVLLDGILDERADAP